MATDMDEKKNSPKFQVDSKYQTLSYRIEALMERLNELKLGIGNVESNPDIVRIKSEIESTQNELETMAKNERDDSSGSMGSNETIGEKPTGVNDEQIQRQIDELERKVEEIERQINALKEHNNVAEKGNTVGNNEPDKETFNTWLNKAGIDMVGRNSIANKYKDPITREEFMKVLSNYNTVIVITAPGVAENFMKTAEDWKSIKTNEKVLNEVLKVNNGSLPIDVENNKDVCILIEPQDRKIRNVDGDAKISEDDVKKSVEEATAKDDKKESIKDRLKRNIPAEILKEYVLKTNEECEKNYKQYGMAVVKEVVKAVASPENKPFVNALMQICAGTIENIYYVENIINNPQSVELQGAFFHGKDKDGTEPQPGFPRPNN